VSFLKLCTNENRCVRKNEVEKYGRNRRFVRAVGWGGVECYVIYLGVVFVKQAKVCAC
jgi:hypothetical protein